MMAYSTPSHFLYLRDSIEAAQDRAFVARNFGLIRSTRFIDRMVEAVPHTTILVHQVDRTNLLKEFLEVGRELIVPRDLSRLYAPRPYDLEFNPLAETFQLVIGDTIDEVLFAWNRPLTSRGQAGRDVLWIDAKSTQDAAFLQAVGQWIGRVFWTNQGQRHGAVVSYSQDVEALRSVADAVKRASGLWFEAVRFTPGEFPLHARPAYRRLSYPTLFEEGPRRTEQIPMSENKGLLTVPRPPFVVSTGGLDGWMVDLDIEYRLDPPRFSNRFDSWRLPRRAWVAQLFSSNRSHARVLAGGLPSVSVGAGERSIPLHIPSKSGLLWSLLEVPAPCESGGTTVATSAERRFNEVYPSEQGLRFQAMVDVFGGIGALGRTFEDVFWRTVFTEGAGKPLDDVGQRTAIVTRELTAARTLDPTATRVDELARKIVQSLHQVPPRQRSFTCKELRDLFSRLNASKKIATEKGERPIRFTDYAQRDFEWLLGARILLQGVTLKCPVCGIPQWRIVDDLGTEVRCEGCTADFPLPPEPTWTFRVSSLVESALVRDGVLPLLHATADLADGARELALVVAPQELREVYDGPIVTDLDIIVIRDGRFIIGEVKSNPSAFDDKVIQTLADVAQSIQPDELILAAPGSEWPQSVESRIEELRRTLEAADITVSARLMAW